MRGIDAGCGAADIVNKPQRTGVIAIVSGTRLRFHDDMLGAFTCSNKTILNGRPMYDRVGNQNIKLWFATVCHSRRTGMDGSYCRAYIHVHVWAWPAPPEYSGYVACLDDAKRPEDIAETWDEWNAMTTSSVSGTMRWMSANGVQVLNSISNSSRMTQMSDVKFRLRLDSESQLFD